MLAQFRRGASSIHYFIFDLLVCNDRDLTGLALNERRDLMKSVLRLRSPRIRIAEQFEVSASDMLDAVRQQQLEGVIGKRKDSLYEAGERSGVGSNAGRTVDKSWSSADTFRGHMDSTRSASAITEGKI
jgi:bifunctional non-homologous end joining protein LigD